MRILFLSRWFPYPADNGSKLRISNLIKQLSLEHQVYLVSFRQPGHAIDPSAEQSAASACSAVYTAPYPGYRPSSVRALAGLLVPRPRSLEMINSKEFGALFDRVFHLIREEVMKTLEQQALAVAGSA